MFNKQYSTESIKFGYNQKARKWTFETIAEPRFTLVTPVRGGASTGLKIANIIAGGLKRTRTNSLDNLARTNIARLVSA